MHAGQIVMMKFPQSQLPGNRAQPEAWFPCIVTELVGDGLTHEFINVKVFHNEQVFQKNSIPLKVVQPDGNDAEGRPKNKVVDNPDVQPLADDMKSLVSAFMDMDERLRKLEKAVEAVEPTSTQSATPTQPQNQHLNKGKHGY